MLTNKPLCINDLCGVEETTAGQSSGQRKGRRNDDSELVELSEGSHDESEAEMSGSDDEDDD